MSQEKAVLVKEWISNNDFVVEPDESDADVDSNGVQIDPADDSYPVDDVYNFKDERRLSGSLSEAGWIF